MLDASKDEQHITVQVLRWIAVLPAALISAVLAMFPLHWFLVLLYLFRDSESDGLSLTSIPMETAERTGYAFITSLTLVYVGAWIAPKLKFQTGIALAVLWGVAFVAATTYTISHGYYHGWGWLRLVAACLLGAGGIAYGLHLVRKKL